MKRFFNLFCVVTASLLTSGCMAAAGLALIDADGEACDPSTLRQAHYLHASLPYLKQGTSKRDVIRTIGTPEKTGITNHNGSRLSVYSYRTGNNACANMPTQQRYTHVYFKNNTLVGYNSH